MKLSQSTSRIEQLTKTKNYIMKRIYLSFAGIVLGLLMQAQVSKTIDCSAGTLPQLVSLDDLKTITDLTITGTMDVRDFYVIRDNMPELKTLDLSAVTISAFNDNVTFFKANEIPVSGLSNCTFTSVSLPKSITSIADYGVNGCMNLLSIEIPATVKNLAQGSFNDCVNLTSISIPSTVKTIGGSAFNDCIGLETVTLSKGIEKVGDYAFHNCVKLKSVTVAVDSLGGDVFSYCPLLESVTLSEGLVYIGRYAFTYCNSLKSVTMPSTVKNIDEFAFQNCEGLTSLTLNEGLVTLGNYAFNYCTNLKGLVTIPSTVKTIGLDAFNYNKSLDSLVINGADTIKWAAFYQCFNLKGALVIPPTVKYIDASAFYGDTNLTSISIPASVDSLGWSAFGSCSGLKSIYVYSKIPMMLKPDSISSVFNEVDTVHCVLFVPFGSKAAYQKANQWKNFKHIEEINTITISQTSLAFTSKATTKKIFLATNAPWTIESDSPWLTISPSSGTGNDSITITVEANTTAVDRIANITVQSSEAVTLKASIEKVIILSQAAGNKTGINGVDAQLLTVYPNPATSYFSVNTDQESRIELYDVNSQLLQTTIVQGKETISLSVKSGMYFVKIINKNGVVTKTLIVE